MYQDAPPEGKGEEEDAELLCERHKYNNDRGAVHRVQRKERQILPGQ